MTFLAGTPNSLATSAILYLRSHRSWSSLSGKMFCAQLRKVFVGNAEHGGGFRGKHGQLGAGQRASARRQRCPRRRPSYGWTRALAGVSRQQHQCRPCRAGRFPVRGHTHAAGLPALRHSPSAPSSGCCSFAMVCRLLCALFRTLDLLGQAVIDAVRDGNLKRAFQPLGLARFGKAGCRRGTDRRRGPALCRADQC